MRLIFAVLSFLGASVTCGAASSVSGSSAKFIVDTRPDLLVEDVSCAYCSGAYGGVGGRSATFISGVRCEIEFTIRASAREGRAIDHYQVNGQSLDGDTFTFNVGNLPAGGELTVVAVDENDAESEPFRVNMEIATPPPMWNSAWLLTIVADQNPSEGRVVYMGPEARSLCLFDALSDAVELGAPEDPLNLNLELTPVIKLWQRVDSSTGQYCEGADAGLSGGNYGERGGVTTIGRFGGLSVTAGLTGGMVYDYDPRRATWGVVSAELGVNYSGSWKVRQRIPQCPILYGEIGISSAGEFVLRERDGDWSGDISFHPLASLRATAGAGLDVVAEGEVSGEGGLYLEARLPGGLERVFLRGTFGWRVVLLGFERSGVWWQADAVLYPRAQANVVAQSLSAAGSRGTDLPWSAGGFAPIPRTYGSRRPAVARLAMAAANQLSNSATDDPLILVHDGYPTPQPCLAVSGTNVVLTYVRETAARADLDQTEIVFRDGASGNAWSGETSVWDDGTADFQPKGALLPDGTALVAWANAKRTFADGTSFETVCSNLELAVGVRDPKSGAWVCKNLTDDASLDWLPVLKGATNGTAAVAWVHNASCDYMGSAKCPSDIVVSFYRKGAWTPGAVAVADGGAVLSHDLVWNGERAVLVWAADADGDLATDDAEIWAKTCENGSWSDAVRLSSPAAAAVRPAVWYLEDGTPHVVWVQTNLLFAADGLAVGSGTNVVAATKDPIPGDYRAVVREDGSATLLWAGTAADGGLGGSVMSASYSVGSGLAAPSPLLRQESVFRNVSGVVDSNGTMTVACEAVAVSTNAAGAVVRGAVDLCVCRRAAVRDVGVTAEDCSFADVLSVGETNMINVGIRNFGSSAVGSCAYRVWFGEGDGKTLLASGQVDVAPLSCEVIGAPWAPAEGLTDIVFTIELDPDDQIGDSDRWNNTLVWRPDVGSPELSLRNATAVKATDDLRLVSVRIHNDAVAPQSAGLVVKFWRGEVGGELIGTDTAGVVAGGTAGEYDVGIAWNVAGVTFTSAWERIVIELPESAGGRTATVWTTTPLYDSPGGDESPSAPEISSVMEISGSSGGSAYLLTLSSGGKMFVIDESWFVSSGIDIANGVSADLLNAKGANGIPRYQSFLFGLDPESSVAADEQIKATISFDAEGNPVVSCTPKSESEHVVYATLGKAAIDDVKWEEVTDENRSEMRFFKVQVEVK